MKMQENEITSKRDYSKYHYIVLQLRKANNESQAIGNVNSIAENEIDICQKVANSISGGILVDSGVGKVLDDHCVVAIEKHSTNPQIPSHVLQKRTILEGNYHDDSLLSKSHSVVWAEEQIPYNHLFKRGPIPPPNKESEFIMGVRAALDLQDPGFTQQWHLVSVDHLLIECDR